MNKCKMASKTKHRKFVIDQNHSIVVLHPSTPLVYSEKESTACSR
jgi:hypothetical protein